MNIFYYASSNRSYTPLLNVYKESVGRDIPSFFLYNQHTDIGLTNELDKYNYSTNVEHDFKDGYLIETLGLKLPFKPDVVILARERWQPEQGVIHELKGKYDSKIFVVEVSSHLINNIENRLEMISRDTGFPQKLVDGYFEHSEFAKQRRIDCLYPEWEKKSIVVGNPRFDELSGGNDKESCINKYNIDSNKKQILFWGVINTTRNKVLSLLKDLQEKNGNKYQIFYKPNPQEPYNPLFSYQFQSKFIIPGVEVIYDDNDINAMSDICDIHIGSITSILNYALYFNKKIVNLNSVCDIDKYMNDFSRYENELKEGVEDSASFWMGVFNIKTIDEFKNFIDLSRLEKFKKTNNHIMDISKKCTNNYDMNYKFLTDKVVSRKDFVKLFDEFNDKNASKRIINYLEEIV